jgi:hypothetical protein
MHAMRLTVQCFVAPNSWTLDVSRVLMNSEIQLGGLARCFRYYSRIQYPQLRFIKACSSSASINAASPTLVRTAGLIHTHSADLGKAVALYEQLLVTLELTTSPQAAYSTRAIQSRGDAVHWQETAFVLVPRGALLFEYLDIDSAGCRDRSMGSEVRAELIVLS